jgi:hypothetical protein
MGRIQDQTKSITQSAVGRNRRPRRAFLTAKRMDRQRRRHSVNKFSGLIIVRAILGAIDFALPTSTGGKAPVDRIRVDQY